MFAFSDTMAVGACRAIAEAGKRIPQDYSVAGFDGIELCSYYNPTLTTIRQPIAQEGEYAAKEMIRQLRDGAEDTIRKELDLELVIRQSA